MDEVRFEEANKAVCKQFGADYVPSLPDSHIGFANSTAKCQ